MSVSPLTTTDPALAAAKLAEPRPPMLRPRPVDAARLAGAPWVARVLLAPMAEITCAPFRRLCRELGAGCAVTEMSKARYVVEPNEDTERTLFFTPAERPVGAQIVGADEDEIRQAAERLAARGFDFIDLNLGCSVRRIVFEGCGGALLTDPTLVERLVRAAREASGLPVTVKMRSGPKPLQVTAPEIARAAEAGGVAGIAIHPRFVSQGYGGSADPTIATQVVQAVRVPVAVGGDVLSPQIAVQLLRTTGAAAVQFGRGAIGRPWAIAETQSLIDLVDGTGFTPAYFTPAQKLTIAWRHLLGMAEHYGPPRAALMFRRHGVAYAAAVIEPDRRLAFEAGMKTLTSVDQARPIFTAAGLPDDAPAFVPPTNPPPAGHRPPGQRATS
ncbi:MAG: tRNA dihydrouridine synthase [Planctomycetota bacterium]